MSDALQDWINSLPPAEQTFAFHFAERITALLAQDRLWILDQFELVLRQHDMTIDERLRLFEDRMTTHDRETLLAIGQHKRDY